MNSLTKFKYSIIILFLSVVFQSCEVSYFGENDLGIQNIEPIQNDGFQIQQPVFWNIPPEPPSQPWVYRLGENQNYFTYCINYVDGSGIVYFPTQNGEFLNGSFPLAIILRGRGYSHTEYIKLQTLLASNFIASVSIDFSEDESFTEETFLNELNTHLEFIYENSSICDINPLEGRFKRDIALIGHSMGGGMVTFAAQELSKLGKNPFNLKLHDVVALAPNPDVKFGPYFLQPKHTPSLLTLLGSNDGDENVNKPTSSAFMLYDSSGYVRNEYTFNGYNANRFQKSMVYIKGADHDAHSDKGIQSYNHAINTYVNAHLQWRFSVLGNNYSPLNHVYFKFQTPMNLGQTVSIQYSDEIQRLVLANFENNTSQFNSLGGKNTFKNFVSVNQGGSFALDQHSPHHTRVLNLKWDTDKTTPSVKFNVSAGGVGGYTTGGAEIFDPEDYGIARYKYFMFRIGQIFNSGFNDSDLDFSIVMHYYDPNQMILKSQKKPLSEFGKVPIPYAINEQAHTISAMNSIIIPLQDFNEVDYSNLFCVEFVFDKSSSYTKKGHIQLDNLEFIKY